MEEIKDGVQLTNENLNDESGGACKHHGVTCGRHRLKEGETLKDVARMYNTLVSILVELNDISSPDDIYVDMIIYYPA